MNRFKMLTGVATAAMMISAMVTQAMAAPPAPTPPTPNGIYGEVYAKNSSPVSAALSGNGLTVNQSKLGSTAVGASSTALGELAGKTDPLTVKVGAENYGTSAAKVDLTNTTLNGGYSAGAAGNGSVPALGGANGQASVSIDGKASATAFAAGASADLTLRSAK